MKGLKHVGSGGRFSAACGPMGLGESLTVESCLPRLYCGENGTPSSQEGRCFEKLLVQGLNPGRLFIEGYGLATTS